MHERKPSINIHNDYGERKKQFELLLWTPYFSKPLWGLEKYGGRIQPETCPVTNCYATRDRSRLEFSQAVLFHLPDLNYRIRPSFKQRAQIWIAYMREGACYMPHGRFRKFVKLYNGYFNWTMGFYRDCDIHIPYGYIRKRKMAVKSHRVHINGFRSKKKLVAWFASNCNTIGKREKYIAELQKYVDVDIYGECGTTKCTGKYNGTCLEMLGATYKFYLAFENSFSEDYVTEKLYKTLPYDVVPVVRGGANYRDLGMPSHSYINTADFKSPKALAGYMLYLHRHQEKYMEYLKWKDEFEGGTYSPQYMFCEICQKLNKELGVPERFRKPHVYKDINSWLNGKVCKKPPKDY